jgi:hypothetical protein
MAKVYTEKTAIAAADLPNKQVIPCSSGWASGYRHLKEQWHELLRQALVVGGSTTVRLSLGHDTISDSIESSRYSQAN